MISADQLKCPRCGSTQIHAEKRGWRLTTGFIGSGKIMISCLNCGRKGKPGSFSPSAPSALADLGTGLGTIVAAFKSHGSPSGRKPAPTDTDDAIFERIIQEVDNAKSLTKDSEPSTSSSPDVSAATKFRYCNFCGHQLPKADVRYCRYCGREQPGSDSGA